MIARTRRATRSETKLAKRRKNVARSDAKRDRASVEMTITRADVRKARRLCHKPLLTLSNIKFRKHQSILPKAPFLLQHGVGLILFQPWSQLSGSQISRGSAAPQSKTPQLMFLTQDDAQTTMIETIETEKVETSHWKALKGPIIIFKIQLHHLQLLLSPRELLR
jgi:hypothetical protein